MAEQLLSLAEECWVYPGRTNTGVITLEDGRTCLVIDPGQDRDSAKQLQRSLQELGLAIGAVVFTHAHADHFGAAHFLKSEAPLAFFASEFEAALIEQPLLEPLFLFGGAEPIPELTHKFLLAKPVPVAGRLREGVWELGGVQFSIRSLPGHSPGQIGIVYRNILFGGDVLTLTQFIEKYKFPFYSDIAKARRTLELLSEATYDWLVPGHGPLLTPSQYQAQIRENLAYLAMLADMTEMILEEKGPLSEEEVYGQMAERLATPLVTPVQYVLNRTLVLALLKYLYELKRIRFFFQANRWLWGKI
jgi:glyoxylase-like metal-dependent hydrolase (beta-lactamase superfamily II)